LSIYSLTYVKRIHRFVHRATISQFFEISPHNDNITDGVVAHVLIVLAFQFDRSEFDLLGDILLVYSRHFDYYIVKKTSKGWKQETMAHMICEFYNVRHRKKSFL
jgi:hypothetical protein